MSEYRVDTYELTDPPLRGWSYRVYQPDVPMGPVWCYCATQADAERIARALRLLDTMERPKDDPALCPAGHGSQCCGDHAACRAVLTLDYTEPQP